MIRGWPRAWAAQWSIGIGAVCVWLGWAGWSSAFSVRLPVADSVLRSRDCPRTARLARLLTDAPRLLSVGSKRLES